MKVFLWGEAREFPEAREFSPGATKNPGSDASRQAKHKLSDTIRLCLPGPKEMRGEPSVPAGRLFEMNLDDLIGILDFVPAAVGFPAFGDDLDQNFSERSVGNVGDAVAIGLHIELGLLVLEELALLDVLHIDAGVLDGFVVFTAGDFDGEPVIALLARRVRLGLGRRCVLRLRKGSQRQEERPQERSGEKMFAQSHDANSILPKNKGMGQVGTRE